MKPEDPVFINAWWRSSSTYVWSRLRRDNTLRCYYEPLNERISTLKPSDIESSPETAISQALRHPAQTENYFSEYLDLIKSGTLNYSPDLAYERYILKPGQEDKKLLAYLSGLISSATSAGKKPVLCFCRSQMRSAWMRHALGGVHVAQIRSPINQWQSFQVNHYFTQKMVTIALHLHASNPEAFSHIKEFHRQAGDIISGKTNAINLSSEDMLSIFLVIWIASTLQAISTCDYLLDVERLSEENGYQIETSEWFRAHGCTVDFSDCAAPSKSQSAPYLFQELAEKAAHSIRSNASPLVLMDPAAIARKTPQLSTPSRQLVELALG